jgi:N4-gp56 family major capsid protein
MANAYTTQTGLAGAVPNYYYKLYLERMVNKMRMLEYVTKRPVPLNEGSVVYFARMTNSSTTPSAYKVQYSAGYGPIATEAAASAQVSATVEKFANAKAILDVTALTAINSTVEETVREQGDQAGSIIDIRITQEAYGTSSAPAGYGFSCFAYNTVGKNDLGSSTSAYSTYVGTAEYGMAASTVRSAVSKLLTRSVEPLDEGYFALIVAAKTAYALQADSTWQASYQYTDPENLRKGIAGDYAGARIVIDNNILTSAGGSGSATLYYSLLMGRGALTVSDLDGGAMPQFYTVKGADKFDPVDEFITVGWKAMFAVCRTNVSAGLVVITAD